MEMTGKKKVREESERRVRKRTKLGRKFKMHVLGMCVRSIERRWEKEADKEKNKKSHKIRKCEQMEKNEGHKYEKRKERLKKSRNKIRK